MENKQTAVEWLAEKLSITFQTMYAEEIEQALEMEKKQMMKTWTRAIDQTQERAWNVVRAYDDFDDYYNETYGK